MSREPLFSICVPSRDRFETASRSIRSILDQSFRDFEILVSDNSVREGGQLLAWLSALGPDREKVRITETGGKLEMDQNWEACSLPAQGRYVLFMADRWLMRPGALALMADVVQRTDPDIFFWPGQKFDHVQKTHGAEGGPPPIHCITERAEDVFTTFLQFRGFETSNVYGQPIPRALNSGYRRELGTRAREIWGELFRPISPDYTSAIALLLLAERCVRIDEMMYHPIGNKSNFSDTTINGLGHYKEKWPGCEKWRGLEIDVVFPTVLNDIERTLEKWPERDVWLARFNVENALKCVIWELHFKEFNGSLLDTAQMRREVYAFAKTIGLEEDQVQRIRNYDHAKRHRFVPLRKLLRAWGLYDKARNLNNAVRYRKRMKMREEVYTQSDVRQRDILFS
ncbi:MAG TPA: glycosyltransferase [Arenimonas sp.]|uniref:glycosyltransferase n=1 Tax=Arenimonas sp. TaxID=1872635 RepID=UPI002D80022D|nr:glycosyltransferase [Arenimonas sp.]HEU0152053.1 glycosyltransferase [Arenimonas sp.]